MKSYSVEELIILLRDYSEGPSWFWGEICEQAADLLEEYKNETPTA